MRSVTTRRRIRLGIVFFGACMALILSIPASIAAAQDAKPTISVTGVDTGAGTVEITNHGDAEVDVNGLILCNFPAYAPIEGAPTIAPGASITVDSAGLGVGVSADGGEMGIYTVPEYENPDAMITYVEWGEAGHQRSPVAIQAGVWAEGVAEPVDGVITASVANPTSPADWAAAAAEEAATTETTELAATGSNATMLVIVAGVLLAVGFALTASTRQRTT